MIRIGAVVALLSLAFAAACGDGGSDGSSSPSDDPLTNTVTSTPPASSPEDSAAVPTPVSTGDRPLYLALGDSLSAGIGATDENAGGFVGLVHAGLEGYDLLNLGIPGDTSAELLAGPLGHGIEEIEARASDGIEGNEIAVITLEIGGNDLLGLYFDLVVPGTCPSVTEALQRDECVDGLRDVLRNYQPNLAAVLSRLKEVAPGVPMFVMTLYNPFSGKSLNLDEIGILALEGGEGTPFPEGLNDIIRAEAANAGATLVDWYPLFLNKGNEYIAQDLIHPNDDGHAVMADAILQAMAAAGLP